jgi:2-methylisocitrate lyase-like PEP mutase family enzyme
MDAVKEMRARFRALHERGCFAIPNPWDLGSLRALEGLGFEALATTSAGFAFTRGLPDTVGALNVDAVVDHLAEMVAAAEVPLNADFQSGYAEDAESLADNVRRCLDTGVAGFSIEDTASPGALFELPEGVERIVAARAALDAAGGEALLTARAECYLVGQPDPLAESIRRLRAYSEAGADVLFAPGIRDPEHIRAIVEAVHPKPVNVLVSADTGLGVQDLAELGVRRISVGSGFARVGWGAFMKAAATLARQGSFAGLDEAASFAELNEMFSTPS